MVAGFAAGFVIYDYFAHDEIDWVRAIVVAVFAIGIMTLIGGNKKN